MVKYRTFFLEKIVRDKTIDLLKEKEIKSEFTIIKDHKTFEKNILKKLLEEVNELIRSYKNQLEELVDIFDVFLELLDIYNIPLSILLEESNKKREIRGGFKSKIFINKISIPDIISNKNLISKFTKYYREDSSST